jgi:hypothetical protein
VVASNEVGDAHEVLNAGPAMRVERDGVTRLHTCEEDPHAIVLEDDRVMLWCRNDGVEGLWPMPFRFIAARHLAVDHSPNRRA